MLEPNPVDPSLHRSPDFDLAFAFAGGVVVGVVSGVVGAGLNGLFWTLWGQRWDQPGLWFWGGSLGLIAGIPWGFLTLIVTATSPSESRRGTTWRMFAILSVLLIVLINAVLFYSSLGGI